MRRFYYRMKARLCCSIHDCSLHQAISTKRTLIITSINQPARRRSSSTSAFALSSITQMRPRWSSNAWQEDYHRVSKFPRQEREEDTRAHSIPSTVERDSKSSDSSNVGLPRSTSPNSSIMYPSTQRIESAKEQSEDPPLDQLRTTISKSWVWEILALLFSIVCMSAIIAVLAFEDGKQVDQWGM